MITMEATLIGVDFLDEKCHQHFQMIQALNSALCSLLLKLGCGGFYRKPRVQGVLWLSAHLQHNEEKIFGVPSNLLCHLGSVDFELYRFRRRWNFVSDLDVETWTNIVLHE